jgi:hypothetical protein
MADDRGDFSSEVYFDHILNEQLDPDGDIYTTQKVELEFSTNIHVGEK